MKATLEFNLPEEDQEFRWAMNAVGYVSVIQEALRKLKYHQEALIPVTDMREQIWESLKERGLEV